MVWMGFFDCRRNPSRLQDGTGVANLAGGVAAFAKNAGACGAASPRVLGERGYGGGLPIPLPRPCLDLLARGLLSPAGGVVPNPPVVNVALDRTRPSNNGLLPAVGPHGWPITEGDSMDPAQLQALAEALVEAGVQSASPIVLHLRAGVKQEYLGWLAGVRPDLLARYQEIYGRRSYAPKAIQAEITSRFQAAFAAARRQLLA